MLRKMADIDQVEWNGLKWLDALDWAPGHSFEGRAPDLMTPDDLGERALKDSRF
jgi:hypothetical protein